MAARASARTLIGGCIFIYSGYARLISFEINFITKETSRAEPEFLNIRLSPIKAMSPVKFLYGKSTKISSQNKTKIS